MIINIWSTPRTGSTWLASYISQQYPKSLKLRQFLNEYYLKNYSIRNEKDWIYEYRPKACYKDYYIDLFSKQIKDRIVHSARLKDVIEEEKHRINLINSHNSLKWPLIIHNHVLPMSEHGYNFLKTKAERNIYLYRKNISNQLASYALGFATKIFTYQKNIKPEYNIFVDKQILENLADRIIYWHKLDKTNCEIIAYEDLNFNDSIGTLPKKQNSVAPINQLCEETVEVILELEKKIKTNITL